MFVYAFGEWLQVISEHDGGSIGHYYWCKDKDGKTASIFPCEVKAICKE